MKCYCYSGLDYSQCCEPLLKGQRQANSPIELMRSRYSAFATNNNNYINQTMAKKAAINQESNANSPPVHWAGLDILQSPPPRGDHGEVVFIAHYTLNGKKYSMQEHSLFEKISGKWFYVDCVEPH